LQKECSIGTAGGKSWSLDLPVLLADTQPVFPVRTEGIYLHTNFMFQPQGTIDNQEKNLFLPLKQEHLGIEGKSESS